MLSWNSCLNHLLILAKSHIESVIPARFIEAVNSCKDKNACAVLKLLSGHIMGENSTQMNSKLIAVKMASEGILRMFTLHSKMES